MRVFYIAACLAGIAVIGTIGYTSIEGWDVVDSFYMTIITLTTVGYGEVRELSTIGRMFTVALLLVGVGMVFYGAAIIAEARFEERIRQIFGRRKLVKELDKLKNHHIICGYGRIGSTVAGEYAKESLPHVIIESDESITSHLDQEGKLVILGDATRDETLIKANVEKARSLVCALPTDAENVFVTLTARALNPNLFILSRAALESSIGKMEAAGADRVISPYIMGGMRIAQSVLRPKLAGFIDEVIGHATTDLDFDEVTVPEGSDLVGMALRESEISQETGVYLLSIRHRQRGNALQPGGRFSDPGGRPPLRPGHARASGIPAQARSREVASAPVSPRAFSFNPSARRRSLAAVSVPGVARAIISSASARWGITPRRGASCPQSSAMAAGFRSAAGVASPVVSDKMTPRTRRPCLPASRTLKRVWLMLPSPSGATSTRGRFARRAKSLIKTPSAKGARRPPAPSTSRGLPSSRSASIEPAMLSKSGAAPSRSAA